MADDVKEDRKVLSMFDRKPVQASVDEMIDMEDQSAAIELLSQVLEDMKNGLFAGFVMVLARTDGGMTTVMSQDVSANPFMFLGGVSRLQTLIHHELDQMDMADHLDSAE